MSLVGFFFFFEVWFVFLPGSQATNFEFGLHSKLTPSLPRYRGAAVDDVDTSDAAPGGTEGLHPRDDGRLR